MNVLKDELGNIRLKLCDFTFAKTLAKSEMTTTVCGSPLYMVLSVLTQNSLHILIFKFKSIFHGCLTLTAYQQAPEVLNAQPYTEKADLWSVGVIMYQILFDEYPFFANSSVQLGTASFI